MNDFLMCFSGGACFLLSFLLFFHPLNQNQIANKWLAVFVFIMGTAVLGIYFRQLNSSSPFGYLIVMSQGIQFLWAPSLWFSTLFFVDPKMAFKPKDYFHFIPFALYVVAFFGFPHHTELMKLKLFEIGNTSVLLRDLLPLQLLIYVIQAYRLLMLHQANLKQITASVNKINLAWLSYFLLILLVILAFWLNDALFAVPILLKITPIIYTAAIFFLAYFSIRQRTIFAFHQSTLQEIAQLLANPIQKETPKPARLSPIQLETYAAQLQHLMDKDRLFLDSDLSLPTLAKALTISIHDTSYLINKLGKGNFYQFINHYRVEEAKKLLSSNRVGELNMLGIAFAAGFNSKTAFNTTFKKQVGLSPSAYAKSQNKA